MKTTTTFGFQICPKYNSYLYYCLFQLPMRAFWRARLVEREELPRPPAADLPVRGQRLALQRPRAVEENGDRVKVVLTVTLVQHDERRNRVLRKTWGDRRWSPLYLIKGLQNILGVRFFRSYTTTAHLRGSSIVTWQRNIVRKLT